MKRVLVGLLLGGGLVLSVPLRSAGLAGRQAAPSTARASETALDRYVAAPDPNFAWTVSKTLPVEGATATLIDLTSQRWLTEQEVEQPLWKHWLVVVTPEKVTSDVGLLFISGVPRADRTRDWIHNIGADSHVVVHLKQSVVADVPATARVVVDPDERRPLIEAAAKRWGRTDVPDMLRHSPLIVLTIDDDTSDHRADS